MTDFKENQGLPSIAGHELSAKWGWFVALGICLFILGLIAAGNMVMATVASVFYVGLLMCVGGVAQLVHAFTVKTWSRFIFLILCGLLYLAAGLMTCAEPLPAATILTLFLGVSMIVIGALRIWIGFGARPATGWGWIAAAGLVTLLVGLMIVAGWPVNSLFILGLFLAIDLLVQGSSFVLLGLGLKS